MIDQPPRPIRDSQALNEGVAPSAKPRLAIFGGSFNPVHNGHLFLAGEMIRQNLADEVLFVPAARPPHKDEALLTSAEHRLAMLAQVLEPYPQFSLSDIELSREGRPSYTIETLDLLDRFYPDNQIIFLMGMDSLVDLHNWHRASELVGRFDFIVYPREGSTMPRFDTLATQFGVKNAKKLQEAVTSCRSIPISATDVRQCLSAGKSPAGMIPESVLAYIQQHKLYQ